MKLDHKSCYRALTARDARFDGLFFVGVTTTGIYCRPVCTARTPGADRCRFFPSAAAAEQERFRPCLRCRPELAPGQAPIDATSRTALLAAARIEAGALTSGTLEELAADLGIGERQLRRVTKQFLGVSPIELAQTRRLLLAKQLLTETRLPIIDVALASGFASLRRFNSAFRDHYRLAPRNLRKQTGQPTAGEPLRLMLGYRPPLAWKELLAFLAARAIPGVELVSGNSYQRTIVLGKQRGWVRVTPHQERPVLVAEIAPELLSCLPEVIVRLRNLFDLNARPDVVRTALARDCLLRDAVRRRPGLRVPGCFDGFELALRAVVGQQTSVRAATTLAGRLAERFGTEVSAPIEGLDRASPAVDVLADASPSEVAAVGLTAKRAESLVRLARSVAERQIALAPGVMPEATIEALCGVPGIGDWTAQYIAMRALRWPDAFPAGDLVLRRRLGGRERSARNAAEAWRPWRAYGAMHLWMM